MIDAKKNGDDDSVAVVVEVYVSIATVFAMLSLAFSTNYIHTKVVLKDRNQVRYI